jgi:UDP-glucuronate 4-epimerase
MAHTYSHLFRLPTTGLRFFTVYGPWGRPDMSPILFAGRISRGEPIDVFNHGHHSRDFTYIDDIVEGVVRTLDHPATPDPDYNPERPNAGSSDAPYRVYNIGNDQPVPLLHFIDLLEQQLGRRVEKRLLPMQPGDVADTWADVSALRRDVGYAPGTSIEQGVARFVAWYREYYGIH